MGIEIERKFLVRDDAWKRGASGLRYCQGYISRGSGATVRVRTRAGQGFLTIKKHDGEITYMEYEYEIPHTEAQEMLAKICVQPVIVKDRFRIVVEGFVWEVDEFMGENRGLVVAEIELEHPEQVFPLPGWIGPEVSGDPKYSNASLVSYPYSRWQE